MVSEFDKNKFDTSTTTSEDEKGEEEGHEVGELKEEDKLSSVTCSSCNCKQAVIVSGTRARPERERFVSRMV